MKPLFKTSSLIYHQAFCEAYDIEAHPDNYEKTVASINSFAGSGDVGHFTDTPGSLSNCAAMDLLAQAYIHLTLSSGAMGGELTPNLATELGFLREYGSKFNRFRPSGRISGVSLTKFDIVVPDEPRHFLTSGRRQGNEAAIMLTLHSTTVQIVRFE
jgi:hypothetical protein